MATAAATETSSGETAATDTVPVTCIDEFDSTQLSEAVDAADPNPNPNPNPK